MCNVENLNSFEKNVLLNWFLHYLPMGSPDGQPEATKATRFEFFRQFPAIYNKLVGREIVRVTHLSENPT
jgi:hypothetical protein